MIETGAVGAGGYHLETGTMLAPVLLYVPVLPCRFSFTHRSMGRQEIMSYEL